MNYLPNYNWPCQSYLHKSLSIPSWQVPCLPFYPYPPISSNYREHSQFPPVNPEHLKSSAKKFQALMKEAQQIVVRIGNDEKFAYELMNAAQLSQKEKVENMIKSTGITIKSKVDFTPTGIRIFLDNSDEFNNCCDLLIALRW